MDLRARILKNENECYYTIGSSGHEGNAVWGKVFRLTDMAFVHYRSCAFMIQRAKQVPGSTPLYDTMLSFVASSDDPIAGGRHKVFGSYPLLVTAADEYHRLALAESGGCGTLDRPSP